MSHQSNPQFLHYSRFCDAGAGMTAWHRISITPVIRPFLVGRLVVITAMACRETLHAVNRTALGKAQKSVADDLAASIEAKQHVALDELPLDPHQNRGIILLPLLGI